MKKSELFHKATLSNNNCVSADVRLVLGKTRFSLDRFINVVIVWQVSKIKCPFYETEAFNAVLFCKMLKVLFVCVTWGCV